MNASPAPVPSTAVTAGAAARATSRPPARSTAPSAPAVTATSAARSSPSDRGELGPVGDDQVGPVQHLGRHRRRRRRVQAEQRAPAGSPAAAAATVRIGTSSWQSTASAPASSAGSIVSRAFAPGTTTIVFSPASSTVMSATPVGPSDPPYAGQVDAVGGQQRERLAGRLVVADRGQKRDVSAEPAGGQGLVGALAAGHPAVVGRP